MTSWRSALGLGSLGVILAGCSGGPANGGVGAVGSSNGGASSTTVGATSMAAGTTSTTGGAINATGGAASTTGGATSAGGATSTTGGAASATGGATSTIGGATSTAGGAGGNLGAGGTSTTGGRPSGPSAGCTKLPPSGEALGSAVLHMVDITGMAAEYVAGYTHRKYCTTMPKNYDPTKAYPVVFFGPGCGASACEGDSFSGRTDIVLVQAIAGADATGANIVPKNGAPGCFQAGKEGSADSPEGPYFDQVMASVEDNYCVDKGKVFAAGTSSGAWLSNYLACARGNVIRGTAADSGGLQFAHGTCTGGAAVMEFPGDSTTTKDGEGNEIGSGLARDMFIKLNGCSMTPTTMAFDKANNCQVYGGCDSPVVWCDVGGGHQSGNGYLSPSGWAFWSTLK